MSLVGANGSGKTTLITALTGGREFDGGKLRRGHNVKLGLLAQHADDMFGTGTVVEACQRATGLTPNNARSLLGQFLFSGEEAEKPLDGLSRRRAPAAVAGDPRALRRQRPDPRRAHQPSRRREPRGAGGRAAVLPGRAAADLPRPRAAGRRRHAHRRDRGPDAALLRRRLARVRARARGARGGREGRPSAPSPWSSRPPPPPAATPPKPRSKNEQARAKKLEAEIEQAEAALAALEVELADPGAWNDPRTAAKSTARHAEAKKTLEELYARWEAVAG